MTFRSARKPLIAGLGAAAVFAVVGVSPGAFAAADTSDDPDLIAHVHVTLQLSDATVRPGAHVTATMTVVAEEGVPSTLTRWAISAGKASVSPASGTLGTVYLAPKTVTAQITVPSGAAAGSITVDAVVTGPRLVTAASDAKSMQVVPGTVDKPTTPPKHSPTPTPKPSHSKPPTASPHDPGNNGTPGGGAIPSLPITTAPTMPTAPPVDAPEVALPPVSDPQVATATPDQIAVASTRTALRSAAASLPIAQKIGPGAAGWMAALLAGQILLMTRVRMARRGHRDKAARRLATASASSAAATVVLPRRVTPVPEPAPAVPARLDAPAAAPEPAKAAKKTKAAKPARAKRRASKAADSLPATAERPKASESLPAKAEQPEASASPPAKAARPEASASLPVTAKQDKPEVAEPLPVAAERHEPEAAQPLPLPVEAKHDEPEAAQPLPVEAKRDEPRPEAMRDEPVSPSAGAKQDEPKAAKSKPAKDGTRRRSAPKPAPAKGRAAKRRSGRRFSLLPGDPGGS
ncbi:hypothetical protein [Actinomadura rayongensis]|uniref:Uncharacterized protein n=1 Tax=Actinomadura rayongensis TaxID=1429076 RepID=A0A6I4WAY8_9ACTN|nr:hypothetical protein [Actinomadura rayongensis]MXQ68079.1 hypothetical protein [Actinomadura rayongensis]